MSLTREQLEARRQFVTATDVPAILGASPWKNISDVWHKKVYGVEGSTGNDATDAGNRLEPAVLEWAGERLPLTDEEQIFLSLGINSCTLDARTVDGEPVEGKTHGITGPGKHDEWGEEGTDQIPSYYLLQVHTQILITGAERAFVPALIGGRGFVMYEVQANQSINDYIVAKSEAFMQSVRDRVTPEEPPHIETLKRLRREPQKKIELGEEIYGLVFLMDAIKKQIAEKQKFVDQYQAKLIAALGDAEAATFPGGEVTYLEQTRKAYTVKESKYRCLRIKGAKT